MNPSKKYSLLIDVETTEPRKSNAPLFPIIYDFGACIVDRKGNIVEEYAVIIEEIFCDKDRMRNAFYSNKIPSYIRDLQEGRRDMVKFSECMQHVDAMAKKYDCDTVTAYNLGFDLRAIKCTLEFLGMDNPSETLPYISKLKRLCLWAYAAKGLPMFSYQMACIANGWRTAKGNNRSSAESVGWFLGLLGLDVVEEHKGIEDCRLEAALYGKLQARRVKVPYGLKGNWQAFQPKRLSQWGRAAYYAAA